jgi:hypothetical protein
MQICHDRMSFEAVLHQLTDARGRFEVFLLGSGPHDDHGEKLVLTSCGKGVWLGPSGGRKFLQGSRQHRQVHLGPVGTGPRIIRLFAAESAVFGRFLHRVHPHQSLGLTRFDAQLDLDGFPAP